MFHILCGSETAFGKIALVFHIPGGFETAFGKVALVFHIPGGFETALEKVALVFHISLSILYSFVKNAKIVSRTPLRFAKNNASVFHLHSSL
ncbi:MAG TPA: hypothetical protein VK029_07865 [Pseudogracilibacillus sp.]|nr:hypothetical protein [Pseudogracilibacillus sp.]